MKILKIASVVIGLILLVWIAVSLSKIAGTVDTKKRHHSIRTQVTDMPTRSEHSFTPHWYSK